MSAAGSPAVRAPTNALVRVARYSIVRLIGLFFGVAVAVYLTILVANMGGYVDEIKKGNIDWALGMRLRDGWLADKPTEERFAIFEQTQQATYEAEGLNQPFLLRCGRWLWQALSLDWGAAEGGHVFWQGSVSGQVRDLILDSLPRSLLIFGAANLLLFFTTLLLALALSRRHGGWADRLVVALSPLSAAPAWAYGIILNVLFLRVSTSVTAGGTLDAWPTEFSLAYIPIVLKHMLLPFLSIFVSGFFSSVYAFRAFFVLYSSDDYVEMAKARGLTSKAIERRYILRPGLPTVITSFALLLVGLWQEIIALEMFFNVSGIGRLFYFAIRSFDIPLILGLVVTFAYTLAITVYALDILYALVDPRVRVASEGRMAAPVTRVRGPLCRVLAWLRLRAGRGRSFDPLRVANPRPSTVARTAAKSDNPAPARLRIRRGRRRNLIPALRQLTGNPAAVLGLLIVTALLGISIYAVITIPYSEAIRLWRGDDNPWYRNPAKASPAWTNWFRKDDLPESVVLDSRKPSPEADQPGPGAHVAKSTSAISDQANQILITFSFDYPYRSYPQGLSVYVEADYDVKKPSVILTWLTPDGREIRIDEASVGHSHAFHVCPVCLNDKLVRRLRRTFGTQLPPEVGLFADPAFAGLSDESGASGGAEASPPTLPGTYTLRVAAIVFEEGGNVDAEFVLRGQVHGLAGTDQNRRDLMVGLLWGTPIALSFGILAAVGTSLSTVVIAGISVWFGGWVDSLLQRITEVNMILPFLPVSIMVYTLYSKSFWVILGVTVLLSIFGSSIKNYRAMLLQIKESAYVEAARAYGAGDWRIIFRYLIPRIGAVLLPQIVILIPGYVFLEATLAFLEVSDPVLPTWGKLIVDALDFGAYSGDYHMLLEPAGLLMLTGFAFVMLGHALERVFEPRLREH